VTAANQTGTPTATEANLDGLVGMTHNYAGLAAGNMASQNNAGRISNPKAAALQGIAKMEAVAALGVTQCFLPPQERPAIWILRQHGFTGDDANILADAHANNCLLYTSDAADDYS
jgi:succinylarginine dihydrolase